MANETTIKITADVSGAKKGLKTLSKASKKAFNGVKGGISKAAKGLATFGLAAEGAKTIFAGLEGIFNRIAVVQRSMASAQFMGATVKQAEKFNVAMGRSLSKMQALQELTEFKRIGFSNNDIKTAAKMARAYSVILNISREQALEMVRSGEVNERLLNSFRLQGNVIEDAFIKAKGATIAELTQMQKAQIVMGIITKRAKELGKDLGKIAKKDIVSPFKKFKNLLVDVADALIKKILPFFEKLVKKQGGIDKLAASIIRFFEKAFNKVAQFFNFIKRASKQGFFKTAVKVADNQIRKAIFGSIAIRAKEKKTIQKVAKLYSDEIQKAIGKAPSKDELKAIEKAQKKGGLVAVPKKKKGVKFKGKTQAQIEARDERLAMLSEARARIRNFSTFFLDALSNLGGTISGVFSAQKDIAETFKMFALDPDIRGAMIQFKELGTLTIDQELKIIKARFISGKMTEKNAKALSIMVLTMRAGVDDAEEFRMKAELLGKEFSASLIPLKAQAALVAVEKMEFDRIVDTQKNAVQLGHRLHELEVKKEVILRKIAKRRGKDNSQLFNALKINNILVERTEAYQKTYTRMNEEQVKRIQILREFAKIDAAVEIAAIKRGREIAKKGALGTLAQQAIEIAKLRGRDTSIDELKIQNQQKILAMKKQEFDLTLKLQQSTGKANAAWKGMQEKAFVFHTNEAKSTKGMLDLKKQQIEKQRELNAEALKRAQQLKTFAGSFKAAFAAQVEIAKQASKNMAAVMGAALADSVKAFGAFASETFERLGSALFLAISGKTDQALGDDLSKGVLQFIGGLAAQFATLFGSIGAGMLFLNPAAGIGLLAASAGLSVLAGVIKGGADEMGTGGKTAAPTATIAPSVQTDLGADRARGQDRREVIVVLNSMPWNGDEMTQARRFRDFIRKNRRTIGELV